ncbi:MAG: sulfite exporter TauE/SafE family protein [Candidatus Aenigmarchaeota archaeon]|nr:sulfite exporter TauE/SafE family protein [Candidatus Aenigmarchaeota archaeon]
MVDLLAFWFLFPIGIIIAFFAMSTGISGSNFWIPVFLIWLGIEPKTGFWLGLVAMFFGFASGTFKNMRQGTINWFLVRKYLKVTIPAAAAGALLVPYVNSTALILLFAVFVLCYGPWMIYQSLAKPGIVSEKHSIIHWKVGIVGGFLKGLIATGLGKLILTRCIGHKQCFHHSEAVGSVVFIVFITNIVAILLRLNADFSQVLFQNWQLLLSALVFAVPGVLIGGQIGPIVPKRIMLKHLRVYVGTLLILVGFLMLLRGFALI